MQLGIAHSYLLGISQTLCRGVHLSARPSSRSLLSPAPLRPPVLLALSFSPSHSLLSRVISLSFVTLSIFRSLESPLPSCTNTVYYSLLTIESKEPRCTVVDWLALRIAGKRVQMHAYDTHARAHTSRLNPLQTSRGSHPPR